MPLDVRKGKMGSPDGYGYDGRTGKVTVSFSNEGAREICQGK
jgi:hypothetical protein